MQIHYNQEVVAISRDGGVSWEATTEGPALQSNSDLGAISADIPREPSFPIYLLTDQGQVRYA